MQENAEDPPAYTETPYTYTYTYPYVYAYPMYPSPVNVIYNFTSCPQCTVWIQERIILRRKLADLEAKNPAIIKGQLIELDKEIKKLKDKLIRDRTPFLNNLSTSTEDLHSEVTLVNVWTSVEAMEKTVKDLLAQCEAFHKNKSKGSGGSKSNLPR